MACGLRPPSGAKSKAFLLTDNWDDWFTYSTMYALHVYDADGEMHSVGSVKIGQFNMKEEQRRAAIRHTDELQSARRGPLDFPVKSAGTFSRLF
jgi:hypothetical protein